jgi:hypothetical protein
VAPRVLIRGNESEQRRRDKRKRRQRARVCVQAASAPQRRRRRAGCARPPTRRAARRASHTERRCARTHTRAPRAPQSPERARTQMLRHMPRPAHTRAATPPSPTLPRAAARTRHMSQVRSILFE